MSLKRLRTKLETVDAIIENPIGIVFAKDDKYYVNYPYSQEIDKAYVVEHNLTAIRFKK